MKLKKNNFVPFTVLGDPDLKSSERIIKTYIDCGADMLELGIAFSDPTADGPTIQEADQRVLKKGITLEQIFKLLERIKAYSNTPISILTYVNPVYKFGIEKFYKRLSKIGIEAILIADLPLEEISLVAKTSKKHKIHQVFLVHDKTTAPRLKKILKHASGYLYLVSSSSTTGVRKDLPRNLKSTISRLKKLTKLPLLVGFGISQSSHLTQVADWGANGVIVGSKLVRIIKENLKNKKIMLKKIEQEIKKLLS